MSSQALDQQHLQKEAAMQDQCYHHGEHFGMLQCPTELNAHVNCLCRVRRQSTGLRMALRADVDGALQSQL